MGAGIGEVRSKDELRNYIRTMYYPFSNEQLKELTLQIEIYV